MGAKPNFRGIYMIKEKRYLLKGNSYIVDLYNVDFITWKENAEEQDTYWAKLHIGDKEARYICSSLEELKNLLTVWSQIRGQKIELKNNELW